MSRWKTLLTETFPCRLPIIGAPMAGVSGGLLAAETCRAGGIGFIGAGGVLVPPFSLESLDKEIDIFRQHAPEGSPLAIGVLGFTLQQHPEAWDIYRQVLEKYRPQIVQCFAPTIVYENNNAGEKGVSNVELAHAVSAKFIAQVGSVADAKEALTAGADGIIAQGSEAGGHGVRRELGNSVIPLASQIRRLTEEKANSVPGSSRIPVVAAGAIVNGRSVAAALAVCDGVSIGTRLWASRESIGRVGLQAALVSNSPDGDRLTCDDVLRTTVFDQIVNAKSPVPWPHPFDSVGALRNDLTEKWDNKADLLADKIAEGTLLQEYKKAVDEHNPKIAMVLAGQGVGEIDSIEPAFDIITRIEQETKDILLKMAQIV